MYWPGKFKATILPKTEATVVLILTLTEKDVAVEVLHGGNVACQEQ